MCNNQTNKTLAHYILYIINASLLLIEKKGAYQLKKSLLFEVIRRL